MSKVLTLIILCTLTLSGCTIEKKRYSNGYHTTWNVHKHFQKKTTASNFKSQTNSLIGLHESADLLSNSDVNDAPDSIQKKKSISLNFEKANAKSKKRQLAFSSTDTVPETKIENLSSIKPHEKYDQQKKDKKRVLISWLVLVTSFLAFITGLPIIAATDAGIGYALLGLGVIGAGISIILIIAYTIIKNRHRKQSYIYYNQANPNVPDDPEEIASKVTSLNKKMKSYNIVRFSLLPLSILTLTYLFPFGLASLVLFFIYTSKRKQLIVERNNLVNLEPNTNPAQQFSLQHKAYLQEQLANLKKKMKFNKIFMVLNCLTIIILAAEASTAAFNAIPIFILAILISIVIQLIWSIKKTNIRDELNLSN